MSISALQDGTQQVSKAVVDFTQKLVQTPSPSGQERGVANLIVNGMKKLAYDEVFTDDMGNVVGIMKGSGGGRNIMFNGHMDHAGEGRLDAWQYLPFSGTIQDGYLYGRGAMDMKGGFASEIYAGGLIKKMKLAHRGDIIVTCVVQEEPAECVGMAYLCDVTMKKRGMKADFVVVGEPTNMKLVLGHRGRVELEVKTIGRTSHGSAPYQGINAVYKMLPVLARVQALDAKLPTHQVFSKSTISLTNIWCSPGQLSIIPDLCGVNLDRRLMPDETVDGALAQVQELLDGLAKEDPEFKGSARVREVEEVSYTGMKTLVKKYMASWVTPEDHPDVVRTRRALEDVGQKPRIGYAVFGTDGSHTAGVLGIPTVLYGPGDETVAHTPGDRLSLDDLVQSVAGNASIAMAITE